MNKIKHILSFLILFVMTLLFLHTELDFFTPEQHNHSTHDFCEIVNGVKTRNASFDKTEVLNIDYHNIFLYTPIIISTDIVETIISPQKIKPGTKFRILYNSFLI